MEHQIFFICLEGKFASVYVTFMRLFFVHFINFGSFNSDWIFGEILCVVNNFVANFTVASCVFTMMAISIDR